MISDVRKYLYFQMITLDVGTYNTGTIKTKGIHCQKPTSISVGDNVQCVFNDRKST